MLDFAIKYDEMTDEKWIETSLSGKPLLTIPQLNKGTAFTAEERLSFGLTGKLPTHIETLEQQVERAYLQYQSFSTPLQKNGFLNKLHDTNQILFYKLIEHHETEMLPIIYTPTVGVAVEKYSGEFQQARGLYISYEHRYRIEEILDNRSNPEIDLIVVSDGGGVLGIGDQGVGAMLIPVAKLMVYTICGGVNPLRTLPILLDVGTDNEKLLQDPFYLGWRHPRVTGKEYNDFIDLFVRAVYKKFPNAFLHWEDFGRDNARSILKRYRDEVCSFNDDIQGTGVTTLAALIAAVKATESKLSEQRIVIFGGGTAGTGVADQICEGIIRTGVTEEVARSQIWMIDRTGLLTEETPNLTPGQQPFARGTHDIANWQVQDNQHISFMEVIKHVKPTVLIGCSAVGGAFTQEIIIEMAKHVERPIIFPLSNPTEKSEAIPSDLIEWTQGRALVATGSPFTPVVYKDKIIRVAQCNNALVFPGIGLGVIAAKAKRVTENMLWAACLALNYSAPIHKEANGSLLPSMEKAKGPARSIAIAVAKQAISDGVAEHLGQKEIEAAIDKIIWQPYYLPMRKKRSNVI